MIQEAEKARMKRNRQNFWDIKRIIGNAEIGSGSIHEAGYGEALTLIKKVIDKDKDWDSIIELIKIPEYFVFFLELKLSYLYLDDIFMENMFKFTVKG